MSALDVRLSPSQLKCWQLSHVTSPILGSCVCAHSALLHQLMFSLPSGWHASPGDRGKPCPSALSVVPPLEPFNTAPPWWPAAELQCPMYHPHSVLSPPWAVHHCAPSSGRVADCSARCTQLMYAADAYPQANPAPAQGLPWHALLHTSRLAFHILTAGTLVACSRAWPGHQRSVLNPLAPFSFVPPVVVGARFYRARCLGVALYLSYSLRFVTLSLCDGDEASPSVLSVEPALCRSALHPPSRGRWQPCSARGTGFASPPQCRSTLNLAADSARVRLRLRCSVLHVLVRHSRRYRLPDTRLVIHGGQGWAIPTQCWARSVPFSTALLLKSGWQIRSARCPDPALPSPVAGNARANFQVPCPHTC